MSENELLEVLLFFPDGGGLGWVKAPTGRPNLSPPALLLPRGEKDIKFSAEARDFFPPQFANSEKASAGGGGRDGGAGGGGALSRPSCKNSAAFKSSNDGLFRLFWVDALHMAFGRVGC